jgi:hypothetical protein
MKVCINCDTVNDLDAVFCSQCGMSLMGAPTGEEAVRLTEEKRQERRAERQRRLEQPLTASGIVYLFADQFVTPLGPTALLSTAAKVAGRTLGPGGPLDLLVRPKFSVRVPYSGQHVAVRDLARKVLEAAFVSLARQACISLGLEKTKTLFVSREVVTIKREKEGNGLPPSLERSIMDALAPAPEERRLSALLGALRKGRMLYGKDFYCDGVADVVADTLMEMNWLQRGMPTEEADPLLDCMLGETETVKARLENFAAQNPHLHARLVSELKQLR